METNYNNVSAVRYVENEETIDFERFRTIYL